MFQKQQIPGQRLYTKRYLPPPSLPSNCLEDLLLLAGYRIQEAFFYPGGRFEPSTSAMTAMAAVTVDPDIDFKIQTN